MLHTPFQLITPVDHHVPKHRSKAEQDRKWLFIGTLCRPLGETGNQQRLVKSHAVATMHGTEKDDPSCTPLTEPDFLGILLQNRCKMLPSAHDCARCKKVQKCLHGQVVSIQPKGRHTVVAYKGNHAEGPLSWWVLSVVQTTIFSSEIFRHSLAP